MEKKEIIRHRNFCFIIGIFLISMFFWTGKAELETAGPILGAVMLLAGIIAQRALNKYN